MEKVWLVTGCSSGFGRAIAIAALQAGANVAVGSRKREDVQDIVQAYPAKALSVTLDVTDYGQIREAVALVYKTFGHIDVLVNNAGIGYFGAIEESREADVRHLFEVNFWGLSEMIRQVLPVMRAQRSGHIINIASIGGLRSWPSLGYYHATQYAVDGFSEALYKEVKPLGIHVTVVAPGSLSGKQTWSPELAAYAIFKVMVTQQPPLRLLLGRDALLNAREKLAELTAGYDAWEATTLSCDL